MKLLFGGALVLALAGCASVPTAGLSGAELVSAQAAQQARAAAVGLEHGDCGTPSWVMTGRVALSNGKQGGSGQIEWTQGQGQLRLMLTTPVTRQGWLLEANASSATLQNLSDGATRQNIDASRLLQDATGWDVPLSALGCWMRGIEANPAQYGVAQLRYGADALPQQLVQNGWVIRYERWQQDPFSHQWMPSRMEAVRGNDRVRLIVDRWGLE